MGKVIPCIICNFKEVIVFPTEWTDSLATEKVLEMAELHVLRHFETIAKIVISRKASDNGILIFFYDVTAKFLGNREYEPYLGLPDGFLYPVIGKELSRFLFSFIAGNGVRIKAVSCKAGSQSAVQAHKVGNELGNVSAFGVLRFEGSQAMECKKLDVVGRDEFFKPHGFTDISIRRIG